jgi:hypothetical protein
VTYEACHPNGAPSYLWFLRPAVGIQAPVGFGIVLLLPLLSLFFYDALSDRVAAWWCTRKSYQQVPPKPTKGTSMPDVPPGVAVAIDVPSNSHAGKIDTVD